MMRRLLAYLFGYWLALASAINPALPALTVNQLTGFNAKTVTAGAPYLINANSGTNAGNSTTATSLTWSHTTTAATTALVVGVYGQRNTGSFSISGVTFNGTAMTAVYSPGTVGEGAWLWVLYSPAVTTANIVVTASNAPDRALAGASANLGNVTAVDVSGNNSGNANTTTTVTAVAGGLPVANVACRSSAGTTLAVTSSSPTGMAVAATANTFTNASGNARYQALFYSGTLVGSGSTSLSTTATNGSTYVCYHVYAIFK